MINLEVKPKIHWMCLQMGEMSLEQIELGRLWAKTSGSNYSIPVTKNYLFALFDAAERGLRK